MAPENLKLGQLPLLRGILPINPNKLVSDIVAGVTLAALGIPEVMGYTKIAGTPIVTGLYTLLLPVVAFALLGGSRHLVVAAHSATAAILSEKVICPVVNTRRAVGVCLISTQFVCKRVSLTATFPDCLTARFPD